MWFGVVFKGYVNWFLWLFVCKVVELGVVEQISYEMVCNMLKKMV